MVILPAAGKFLLSSVSCVPPAKSLGGATRRQGLGKSDARGRPNCGAHGLQPVAGHPLMLLSLLSCGPPALVCSLQTAAGAQGLTLQSFLLEEPLEFEFETAGGSLSVIGEGPLPGPAPPAGPQVVVRGMASRDPCSADNHEQLWTVFRHAGCDGFLEIPATRFDLDLYVDFDDQQRAVASGKSYCRHQGHCEGVDIFDAAFFNIPEREALGMDPEQRLFMETGWLSLSDAGYERKALQREGSHLGVFVGISGSDWRDVCRCPSANGVPETFIANRFSYAINLKGPSFIVNTACSASLVAMHAAKSR
ncbi:unnamed protein product, partial [Polarella glacialis]